MFDILDALIATIAVILGLSLIVHAVQQIIKHLFDMKSSYMRAQLLALFSGPAEPNSWQANLQSVARNAEKRASDEAKKLVTAIGNALPSFGFPDMHLLENADGAKLKAIIESLPSNVVDGFTGKLDAITAKIDLWFDTTKAAFQEHYERRMRVWSFILSTAVVLSLNANLFFIYSTFSSDEVMRNSALKFGEAMVLQEDDSPFSRALDAEPVTAKRDSMLAARVDSQLAKVKSILDEKTFQFFQWTPARWTGFWCTDSWGARGLTILGWFAMILLVSLGSPFWYDVLRSIMNIKNKLKT